MICLPDVFIQFTYSPNILFIDIRSVMIFNRNKITKFG